MKITPDKRLFWFLKDGIRLDLTEPSVVDMYVQQVITHGTTEDVKTLLKTIDLRQLKEVLKRIEYFLPAEVRKFWEDFVGGH